MNRFVFTAIALGVLSVSIGVGGTSPAISQSQTPFYPFSKGKNSTSDRFLVAFPKTYKANQIVVSFSDRRLYHVFRRGMAVSYPIAVPRKESRWDGTLRVTAKKVEPKWVPTQSMREENPKLPPIVEGGDPRNPMGARALYLGSTLYRIHGTDAPWTIGKDVSRGCVRMHNEHVMELFENTKLGTRVTATYDKFKLKKLANQVPRFKNMNREFYWIN